MQCIGELLPDAPHCREMPVTCVLMCTKTPGGLVAEAG